MKCQMDKLLTESAKKEIADELRLKGFCHHCRHLFSDEVLIKCNYKSSSMGFPYSDPSAKNSKASKSMCFIGFSLFKIQVKLMQDQNMIGNGYKRHPYLFYQRLSNNF